MPAISSSRATSGTIAAPQRRRAGSWLRRGTGSGLSDIDAGLRLRYEITRKFAPYVGISYAGRLFQSANFERREGEAPNDVRYVFGVRSWL